MEYPVFEKLKSNARAIISNQVALPLGVRKMIKILHWLNAGTFLLKINMQVFIDFNEMIRDCPVGSERLLWEINALKIQDRIIDEAILIYRDDIIEKCFEILAFTT